MYLGWTNYLLLSDCLSSLSSVGNHHAYPVLQFRVMWGPNYITKFFSY
jgi:hypothetical protein